MASVSRIALAALVLLLVSSCTAPNRMGFHGHRGTERVMERTQQEVADLLQATLEDPQQTSQAQTIMDEIVTEVRHSRHQNRELHQQLYQLNASYDVGDEKFIDILEKMNHARMKAGMNLVSLRAKLKALMTREQWKAFTDGLADIRRRYRPPQKGSAEG